MPVIDVFDVERRRALDFESEDSLNLIEGGCR
jgi:hypothetical protein